jgi:hypothetical protein
VPTYHLRFFFRLPARFSRNREVLFFLIPVFFDVRLFFLFFRVSAMSYPLIYVASRASIPERGIMWRSLRARGARISSSWIDEDGPGETNSFSELWARIQREIASSDRLVLYVEPYDFPLKGALVEVGMALALGKPVWVVARHLVLEPHSFRPLGSWAAHPGVGFTQDLDAAMFADPFELFSPVCS